MSVVVPLKQGVAVNRATTFSELRASGRQLQLDIREINQEMAALKKRKRDKLREYRRIMGIGVHLMIAVGLMTAAWLSVSCAVSCPALAFTFHGFDYTQERAALGLGKGLCLASNAPYARFIVRVSPEQLGRVNT